LKEKIGSLESAMVVSQFIGRRVGIVGVRAGGRSKNNPQEPQERKGAAT